MMNNLKIRQDHENQRVGNFGSRKLGGDAIDKIIDTEERRIMKRRVLCKECFEYKSTSGSCSC